MSNILDFISGLTFETIPEKARRTARLCLLDALHCRVSGMNYPPLLDLARTISKSKGFIQRYFQKYATIHTLQEHFLDQARKQGYAQTLMGRRRHLPAINGRGLRRRLAEGAAVNTPIQGTAAEIIKLAMNAIQKRLQREKLKTKMILSVHDELVFDTPLDEERIIVALVKQEMEQVITLEVPLVVEVGVGVNWLEAH